MKRFFSAALLLLAIALPAAADQIITATITVTNAPTVNGETITVNGDTRTWTNSVVFPATQILTNTTIGGSATNMYLAIAAARFANLSLAQLTNGITLQTAPNGPLSVSLSSGWGLVTLTTNFLTNTIVLRLPITVELPAVQTNLATLLAQALESSTYSISGGAPFLTNYVGLTNTQTITGRKFFTSAVFTNELSTNGFYSNPTFTNGVNYGAGIQSRSAPGGGEQFGNGASTTTASGTAVGDGASTTGSNASALGYSSQVVGNNGTAIGAFATTAGQNSTGVGEAATANTDYATALGTQTFATGTNSLAAGQGAAAAGLNSTAIGQGSSASFNNSTALGQGAATTATNQVMIGKSGQSILVAGVLQASSISNAVFASTNNFPTGSDISYQRYALSTLANGNNAGVIVGTNIFCELSGPTGAFTINGIAGGRDGKFIVLLNRTGQNMTIANDSGVDATAANRIYCLTGADKTVTGNSAAMLIYNQNVTHWILLNFTQ